MPALVAAVTDNSGEIRGIHRTFLDPTRKDKARVSSPRRSLGAILGHGVRFGKIDDVAVVGEGIETVLSLKSALPELPMVAALSAAHLAAWKFPCALRRLFVACDNDAPGRSAARRLLVRAEARGVGAVMVSSLCSDFNSDLCLTSAYTLRTRVAAVLARRFIPASIDAIFLGSRLRPMATAISLIVKLTLDSAYSRKKQNEHEGRGVLYRRKPAGSKTPAAEETIKSFNPQPRPPAGASHDAGL